MIASVNRIFLRRSGVRNALPNALSTPAPPRPCSACGTPGNRTLTAEKALQASHASAGGSDLLRSRPGERVRLDLQSNADVTAAEDLYQLTTAYGALGGQDVGVDF